MLSIILPAHREAPYLNRTIQNIYDTCDQPPEIIVVDQGGNGDIDCRAKVITPGENVGERRAMNLAAKEANGEFLLRIDAHCDFSPKGWDTKLMAVTNRRDLTMAVLTAIRIPWEYAPQAERDKWLAKHTQDEWHDWERLPGHWYGLTRLIVSEDSEGRKGLEAKWQKPNRDHAHYHGVHPTMAATGCGMMIRKSFYEEIGGADETLPKMGAIGEEFAIKAWAHGGRCQTCMDVTIGHIFGTGGYPTEPVKVAQQMLYDRYKDVHSKIVEQFPTFEGLRLIRTDQKGPDVRTVIVNRVDTHDTTDPETKKLVRRRIERFRYVWLENEHPDEKHWTEKEVEVKYAPRGTRIANDIFIVDDDGNMIPEENQ